MKYTYLIGWTELNKWYYGVRTANTVDPIEDLWKMYFTSSKVVKDLRRLCEPDVIEVRRVFKTKRSALKWEDTVLRRLNCVQRGLWLNECRGGKEFFARPRSEETKAKIRAALTGRKRTFSKQWKENISKGLTGKPRSAAVVEKLRSHRHTNESKQLISKARKIEWASGKRQLTKNFSQIGSAARLGKPHSVESILKMKESQKNRSPDSIVVCPHCQKTGASRIMKRWHFDKCRYQFTFPA